MESGGGGEQAQPGLYAGKIQSMSARTEKANGDPVRDLEVVVTVGEEYAPLWTYVKTPDDPNYSEAAHGWKLRELTDALKLPPKGSLDTAKQIGKKVNVKVVADTNLDGEYRGRIRNLFLPGKIEEDGEGMPEGGEDVGPLTREELEGWDNTDLKEELEERGIELEGRFTAKKAIDAIMLQEEDGEEGDEPEGDGDENGTVAGLNQELLEDLRTDADFYADWADDDVKAYAEDLGIAGNVSGRKTTAKYIEAITALAEAAQVHLDGAGEASGPEDDYDDWSLDELTDEVAHRNEQEADIKITGRKTKDKLVAALREDDGAAQPF